MDQYLINNRLGDRNDGAHHPNNANDLPDMERDPHGGNHSRVALPPSVG